jgi:hypothetical protein
MVSWFEPQNQVGFGLSVVSQNQREDEDGVGHTSRSSGLLHVDVSRARVSRSGLKTDGDMTMGGARDIIIDTVWRSSRRQTGRYDGLHQILLPLLYHFHCTRS